MKYTQHGNYYAEEDACTKPIKVACRSTAFLKIKLCYTTETLHE